jgi:predicted transcriptional regulator
MGNEAIKLELIGWLTKLDDDDTLDFLKIIKESRENNQDWWFDLTNEQKKGIERGLRDINLGKVTPHSEIAGKYGL